MIGECRAPIYRKTAGLVVTCPAGHFFLFFDEVRREICRGT
jgi:hypothetical protein